MTNSKTNSFSALRTDHTGSMWAAETDWNGGAGPGRAACWFRGSLSIQKGGEPGVELFTKRCSARDAAKIVRAV